MSKSIKNLCKIYLLNFAFVFPGTSKVKITSNLIEHLRNKFQNIPMTKELFIDESIVPFIGNHQ